MAPSPGDVIPNRIEKGAEPTTVVAGRQERDGPEIVGSHHGGHGGRWGAESPVLGEDNGGERGASEGRTHHEPIPLIAES